MKLKRKIIITLLSIMIPILIVGCEASSQNKTVEKSIQAKGYFWKAQKGDDLVYLIGTMHPSKPNINYLNDTMKKVQKETDALALEVASPDKKTEEKLNKVINENLYLKKGEIKDSLTTEEGIKLDKILKSIDIKYEDVKTLTPTGLLRTIEAAILTKLGYQYEGTDAWLEGIYKNNYKKVVGLEDDIKHYNLLNSSTKDLKDTINQFNSKSIEETEKDLNECMYAFIKGDSNYMKEDVEENYKNDKQSYDKLIKNRNIDMTTNIDKLAKEDENYVVAVGAKHFFGPDSILKLLEDKGYKITKLKS